MSASRQFNTPIDLKSAALAATHNSNTVANIFTTGGNVGIGTTAPTSLLSVIGTMLTNHSSGIQQTGHIGPVIVDRNYTLTSGAYSGYGAYGLYKPSATQIALVSPLNENGSEVCIGYHADDSTFTKAFHMDRFGDLFVNTNQITFSRFGHITASGNISSSNLYSPNQTTTNIVATNISTATVVISGGSLSATFNSNTVGNIFTTGGNVGIGITSPNYKLDVNGDINVNSTDGNQAGYITTTKESTFNNKMVIQSARGLGGILFNLVNEGNVMAIVPGTNSAGNVGIGTTSPGSALHVTGTIGAIPVGTGVHMGTDSANNASIIQINQGGSTSGLAIIDFGYSGVNNVSRIIHDNSTKNLTFSVNGGASSVTFQSSGNVGIGTATPVEKLHVNGNYSNYQNSTTGYLELSQGWQANAGYISFHQADGTRKGYIGYGGTTDSFFLQGEGARKISIATNSIDRITITSGGNVGIGTTSPTGPLTIASGSAIISHLIDTNYFRTYFTSGNGTVSAVYNYQSGKNVYWGEGADTGSYIFRGRGVNIEGGTGTDRPLYVAAGQNYTWPASGYYFTTAGTIQFASGGYSANNSILAAGGISSNGGFYATSDIRIKNINDTSIDTNLIDLLNPVQFTYKDILQQGTLTKFGFIAQNVKEYIPGGVSIRKDTIPDIFKKCNITHVDNKIHVHLENHNLKNDDNIKVMVNHQDRIGCIVSVINVVNDNTFVVELDLPDTQTELFIYGREVDDLLDVDYNIMSTLAFAGIKELRQKHKTLEDKYQTLEDKYHQLLNFIQNKFPGEII